MPFTLKINKAAGSDRVQLSPAPLEMVLSEKQPAERLQLVVTASTEFNERPGSQKTVTFRFLDDTSRSLFEPPEKPEPFILKPGESLTLKLKQSLGIARRPTSGPSSEHFERTSDGAVDRRFTRQINFEFIDPRKDEDPDDSDVHVEC